MENVIKLQKLVDCFAKINYKGVYLWKYLQYELISGIAPGAQMNEKNLTLQEESSDIIPDATEEQMKGVEWILDHLTEKEILFGMIPLRRKFQEKYEHTAMDAYVASIEEYRYMVLEPDSGRWEDEDEQVLTKNRVRYFPLGVIGYYGQEAVDLNELMYFLIKEYIYPIEEVFQIEFPRQLMVRCVCKASMVLKERKAFVTFFCEILERVKPKVVCFTHGPDVIICFLHEASKMMGIPTVEIEHGAIIRNLRYPPTLSYSDYYLTHSELLTKPMVKCGMQNVYTVGKPGIYQNLHMASKENRPIVVSFISSLEPAVYMLAQQLAKRLEQQNYIVVYKFHAIEHCSKEEADRVMEENRNWQFLGGEVDVRDVFALSDIVVGMRSTGILDALPFEEIKILVLKEQQENELLDGNQSFFYELGKAGDIVCVENKEQLYEEVIRYERGRKYRRDINHYWPANSDWGFWEFMQRFRRQQ